MNPRSAQEYAFFLLKLRDRSIGEIRHKMAEKKFEPAEIAKTVDFLIEKKFLDDARFVENYIRGQQSFGSAGRYKLKFKLQKLYIPRELIEEKLGNIEEDDELERAEELAKNWLAKKLTCPPEKRYERLGRFLCGKGYAIGTVSKVLSESLKNFK